MLMAGSSHPQRRSPVRGYGAQAVIVILVTAQRVAQLTLAHGLLDLDASALPVRQQPPWSSTV
jgi:hypothetical protein